MAGELGLRGETKGVGLVQPGEEMASRERIPACSYLWRHHEDNRARCFTALHCRKREQPLFETGEVPTRYKGGGRKGVESQG